MGWGARIAAGADRSPREDRRDPRGMRDAVLVRLGHMAVPDELRAHHRLPQVLADVRLPVVVHHEERDERDRVTVFALLGELDLDGPHERVALRAALWILDTNYGASTVSRILNQLLFASSVHASKPEADWIRG